MHIQVDRSAFRIALLFLLLATGSAALYAQVTTADYEKALNLR